MHKYIPRSKINKGKDVISSFQQTYDESLGEAWQRLRDFLRQTSTHGFDEALQINIFLGGLRAQIKLMLDVSVCGKISLKTARKVIEIIENMDANAI